MSVSDLKHVESPLSGGGFVLVLNTGAVINPEAEAMLQALHSRSVGGIKEHLNTLAKRGPEKFMSTFYAGYGHKSIGDCGSITVFIEGVSMLVAKAIQDWPLYSGQEASTRYIDFANQPFIDPIGTLESKNILEESRSFYVQSLPIVVEDLKKRFPRQDSEDEKTYEKAINARAFDIMRGFLPAGASTNLAWHTNLRQAADHLARLRHHPLAEVKEVAVALEDALQEAYPSSFSQKRYEATESYNRLWMEKEYTFEPTMKPRASARYPDFELSKIDLDFALISLYERAFKERPAKTELPKELIECGTMKFRFLLDFASFRDIQRQRAVFQRMPLLTSFHGFEQWYLRELPSKLQNKADELLWNQTNDLRILNLDPLVEQYYISMGFRIPNVVVGSIPHLVYLVELRTTRFVHPTLRKRARQMADVLKEQLGLSGLVLHLDKDPDRFDVKRGTHDIVMIG